MNIAEDIRTILTFYRSLGFERLPIDCSSKFKDNFSSKFRVPSSKLKNGERPEVDLSCAADRGLRDKKAALEELRKEIGECARCKLSKGRKNVVFGEGDPDACLMFIGEAPGREEDIQARPFVGDAGKLLTRLIEKVGLAREKVYIGNIVKCRPPQNRDPEEDEMTTCSAFIDRQIEIISPRIIVSLGRISSQTLMRTKVPITKLRGRFYEYRGIPVMPTFHPAYLLRNPKDKWLVWEDVQKVMERLRESGNQI